MCVYMRFYSACTDSFQGTRPWTACLAFDRRNGKGWKGRLVDARASAVLHVVLRGWMVGTEVVRRSEGIFAILQWIVIGMVGMRRR